MAILQQCFRAINRSFARPRPLHADDCHDLLGRKPVTLDTPQLQRFIAGKRVLVTGAGGSIGSEICRQALRFLPARLVLLDRAENSLFEIDQELGHRCLGADLSAEVADVCDARRIAEVFARHQPQVVFHAAAHKHVPLMEANPGEAVKNNVFGTTIVADAARANAAAAFVLISTDKAVHPSSVMGATKRCAELYVQWLACKRPTAAKTRFLAVRFGNVLGSSGSVVPIFRRQIHAGGPVTVTHPDMQRYFMTIPEASQLVMLAGAIGQGGQVMVLDMGHPVRIVDLAREMIRRAGKREGIDIELRFTGIRPGEKLAEQLAAADDCTSPTIHPRIRVWQLPTPGTAAIRRMLDTLWAATDSPRSQVIQALASCVREYRPGAQTDLPAPPPPNSPTVTVHIPRPFPMSISEAA
jgi:FlaA1/EpsC-like NDP-sugar epimerase